MNNRIPAGTIENKHLNQTVHLKGWVHRRRDLGGLIFIDLRDRSGLVQVVFNPDVSSEALATAETVRSEYVVAVTGHVVKRHPDTVNQQLSTGNLEIIASDLYVINAAKTPPFLIHQEKDDVSDDLRLKYRFIDLRREQLQTIFKMRHNITQAFRTFLNNDGYIEMETPILTKSTPEGARDYLVPSRVHEGSFYALPQSPQIFKQLLMISGFEKYYQIARCFRDEDLRADRQPEFTQVDIETSFMTVEDIMNMSENLMRYVMKQAKNITIESAFKRLTYQEAIARYGTDKPDTRFDMELIDVSDHVSDSSFKVFQSAINSGGCIKLLNAKGVADKYSRKDIEQLEEFAKVYGAKGLAWLKEEAGTVKGPIAKFLTEEEINGILKQSQATDGDLLLFCADASAVVHQTLGALRLKLGKELDIIDHSRFDFLWVTDWPLLEFDDQTQRYTAAHHPFTMPFEEDMDKLTTDPASVRANAYDLVLNGYELGGGSLRNYKREDQEAMFKVLGFSHEEVEDQFGFLLEALEYGAPPHGGIALGLDRIVMLLSGSDNLRDTILFPKTASASDLLTRAPSSVAEEQLEELALEVTKKDTDSE